jgi:putative aldouronate transport system substrate-binding protein
MSCGWTSSDRFGAQLAPQYASMSPLLASAGQSNPVTWGYDFENLSPNHILMAAQSKNKAAALKVINAFYGQDLSIQTLWGDFTTDVTKVDDTTYQVLPPADGTSDPSTWKWTETLADNAPGWIRDGLKVTLPTDLAEAVDQSEPLQAALANVDPATGVYPPYIKMSADDLNTVALNNTTILNLTQTKFADWITNGGVDAQWADYVSQLDAAGLSANVDIYQKYYDAATKG